MSKPKLYMPGISPSCQTVFSTFAHKNVEYDTVEINVGERERAYARQWIQYND